MKESILIIVLTLLMIGVVIICNSSLNKDMKIIDNTVGSYVVFNGDTLLVTNYSIFTNSYALENGVELNYRIIDKLEKITNK